jgi:putative membrane protein
MNKAGNIKKAIMIIAIIVIPLVYSYFYLGAFWDPYSKLDKLPVAVVNQDAGANINGGFKNVGQDFTDTLKNDTN